MDRVLAFYSSKNLIKIISYSRIISMRKVMVVIDEKGETF